MIERILRFLSIHGRKPRSVAVRLLALAGGGLMFLVIVPLLLGMVGRLVANWLALVVPRPTELVAGVSAALLGLLVMLWAIRVFWRIGEGTPVPVAAPQHLVVSGPYRYCRNPIQLGALLYIFGVGCAILSLMAGLVMFLVGLLLGSAYHRFVEERELHERYGSAYDEYRKRTPFLFPRILGRRDPG